MHACKVYLANQLEDPHQAEQAQHLQGWCVFGFCFWRGDERNGVSL